MFNGEVFPKVFVIAPPPKEFVEEGPFPKVLLESYPKSFDDSSPKLLLVVALSPK